MRIPQRCPRTTLGVNITPLVDIVFQLMVFFLVASHLAQQETVPDLALPQAVSAQRDVPVEKPQVVLNLTQGSEGVWVAGRLLDGPALRALLAAEKELRGGSCQVRIRSDRTVPYSRLEPILATCAALGITDVVLATVESD